MKIVGYILVVLSIIGAIVLLITGIREKAALMIVLSFVAAIFGVCTSLAVVYAADVPQVFEVASSAKSRGDSNSKTILKLEQELKKANTAIQNLKTELKELKSQLKNENEDNV